MKIEFWLRIPANQKYFSTVEWDTVPREGEIVEITKDETRTVHSVEWQLPTVAGAEKNGKVKILLR